jgi:hypothetical protein
MELVFITGSAIRRVFIKDRIITLLAAELSSKPLTINLEEIDAQREKFKEMKLEQRDIEMIEQLAKLGSEEEIAKDVIDDFQKTGWRLVKRIE